MALAVQMAGYWSFAISAGERLQMCVLVEKEGAVFGRGGRGQARRQAAHRFAISIATCSGDVHVPVWLHCNWLPLI